MKVWLFLFLYGSVTLIGFGLTIFWGKYAYHRAHNCGTTNCFKDRAFILSTAIALISGGVTITDAARTYGNAEFGLSQILERGEGVFIAIGLIVTIIGLVKMVWLADLEVHPPRWTWLRTALGVTILWAVVASLLAPGVPFNG